jgi:hypothetical protein
MFVKMITVVKIFTKQAFLDFIEKFDDKKAFLQPGLNVVKLLRGLCIRQRLFDETSFDKMSFDKCHLIM